MPINMSCPSCGKSLSAPDTAAGKKAKCPACAQVMTLPAAAEDTEDVYGTAPEASSGSLPSAATLAKRVRRRAGRRARQCAGQTGGEARRPCPECGELIVAGAAKCRFCNAIFDPKLRALEKSMPGGANADLRRLAFNQRGLLISLAVCIGGNILTRILSNAGPLASLLPALAALCAYIAIAVFVALVGVRVYSTVAGVLLGIAAIIPCVNLIVGLIVNQAATKILNQNGVKTGTFGADMSQFSD